MDKDMILQEKEAEVGYYRRLGPMVEVPCLHVWMQAFLFYMTMLCVPQLRRMQEMIAKMQAQMQKQGDGEGDGPHV